MCTTKIVVITGKCIVSQFLFSENTHPIYQKIDKIPIELLALIAQNVTYLEKNCSPNTMILEMIYLNQ